MPLREIYTGLLLRIRKHHVYFMSPTHLYYSHLFHVTHVNIAAKTIPDAATWRLLGASATHMEARRHGVRRIQT